MPHIKVRPLVMKLLPFAVIATVIWFMPLPTLTPQTRHITIEASQFEFNPGRIEVNAGDQVILDISTVDITHGFYLDGYGIERRLAPGINQHIEFAATQVGKFYFRCTIICGSLHPFMLGELVVNPNNAFWKAGGIALAMLIAYLVLKKGSNYAQA